MSCSIGGQGDIADGCFGGWTGAEVPAAVMGAVGLKTLLAWRGIQLWKMLARAKLKLPKKPYHMHKKVTCLQRVLYKIILRKRWISFPQQVRTISFHSQATSCGLTPNHGRTSTPVITWSFTKSKIVLDAAE